MACPLADGESFYIAEPLLYRLRTVDAAGIARSVPAIQRFTRPTVLALTSSRNLYMTDTFSNTLLSLTPSGTLVTLAGGGIGGDGPAMLARLQNPSGLAMDASGIVYFTEEGGHRVRKFDRAANTVTTIAGTGAAGYSGDGGKATSAQLNAPKGVAVDRAGNFYIADTGNHVVRWISAATGNIYTIAGMGASGYNGRSGVVDSRPVAISGRDRR